MFCKKDLRPATLLKKRLRNRGFPVNLTNFLTTPFFIKHLRWLLLKLYHHLKDTTIQKQFSIKKCVKLRAEAKTKLARENVKVSFISLKI